MQYFSQNNEEQIKRQYMSRINDLSAEISQLKS